MPKRINPHLRADGAPKQAFPDSRSAWAAANRLMASGRAAPDSQRVYQCPACKRWHYGKRSTVAPYRRGGKGKW